MWEIVLFCLTDSPKIIKYSVYSEIWDVAEFLCLMNNFKASSVIEHCLRQGVLQPRGADPVVESQVVLLFLLIVSVCVYAVNSPLTAKKTT